ncbi:MAG TPA: hypothetical protein PLG59_14870, partial [bacterium]|nr:hypothetical protein [bacterium]
MIHGCLETAVAVRERLLACHPEAIAVELPRTLEQAVIQACRRLPHLSVVSYEQGDGQPVYVLVEPCDGMIEAIRFALENRIPLIFADRDMEGYGAKLDPLPDPYAIRRIGYEAYLDEYLKSGLETQDPDDRMRESCMAYHLQESARRYRKIALVCGLAHVPGVLREIEIPQAFPIQRIRREGVTIWNLSKRSSREVLSEPAFIQAAYERYRTRSQEPVP